MATRRKNAQEIIIPYNPRPHQVFLHEHRKRFNVWVCHRRFGKTVLCINELVKGAIECEQPRPRFGYITPLYRQAKQVAWDYLKFYTNPLPGCKQNESELRVDFGEGCRIQLFGADNPDALRGVYFDGVILDEYAQMSPRLWTEIVRPAIADRLGWVIFIGTPKGHNSFWKTYLDAIGDPEWDAHLFKASETGIVPPEELELAKEAMSPEEFEQEFECSFEAAIKGAYYGHRMAEASEQGRIMKSIPDDPMVPVHTAWDLGVSDPTAIWFFRQVGREIHLVDYYENVGMGLDFYVQYLQLKAHERGFVYGQHYAPHDILARELGTGRTREEQARSLGLKFRVVPQHKVHDGINAVRSVLPRCYFDETHCSFGIEALRQYKAKYDDKVSAFKDSPVHDQYSHGADAFRYLAMGIRDQYSIPSPAVEQLTFDNLIEEHLKLRAYARADEDDYI